MTRLWGLVSLALSVLTVVILVFVVGCPAGPSNTESGTQGPDYKREVEIRSNRANLPPEDQKLVEAQDYCVINAESRLGSMGPPVKLMIKGQPVFICCEHCREEAEADPDKTLGKLDERKAEAAKKSSK